jgi:hypothetical protein
MRARDEPVEEAGDRDQPATMRARDEPVEEAV